MKWLYFGLAVIFEITGTTLLKMSEGNEKWHLTILSIASYILCFWVFSKALKDLEVGPAYAMWSGLGIIVTTFIGVFYFKDSITIAKVVCIALILLGTIGLNLLTEGKTH